MHQSADTVPVWELGVISNYMLPATPLFLFLLFIIGVYVRHKRQRTDSIRWLDNEIYNSDDTDGPIEFPKVGVISCIDMDTTNLPEWLQKRNEMIFPQCSVEKGEQLGRGQFGAVFKGKLTQGSAVYVNLVLRIY